MRLTELDIENKKSRSTLIFLIEKLITGRKERSSLEGGWIIYILCKRRKNHDPKIQAFKSTHCDEIKKKRDCGVETKCRTSYFTQLLVVRRRENV